ncbi:glycosyltransferase family 2 protein [Flavobacterium oreochromis]|uniref:Glycosyltransferase family 2 protein n=1 Tax=Flavobacterium oreochromis TaxID=2906078 RepID=A0ABW8P7N2_9FLAO|nr:glycosyltransferase family 2 protein [Flavobacterium oreochromis]
MSELPVISFVSPVYKAENILPELVAEINKVAIDLAVTFEIVLVDDRSPDNCWQVMQVLAKENENIKCIRLSKNFGQHPAIMAGLSQVKEWIVVLDCDLQDQPKEVSKLYYKALDGFDVVFARRKLRKDSFYKKMTSKAFSLMYGYFTDTKFDNTIANFGIYNSKVIKEIVTLNDYIKSFPLFVKWVGFKNTVVEVEHSERYVGETSYTFKKLLSLAFNTIISFSNKPLKLFVKFGIIIFLLAFVLDVI